MTVFASHATSSMTSQGHGNCSPRVNAGTLREEANRVSDHPYLSVIETEASQHKQKGNLNYENVVEVGLYVNVNGVGEDVSFACKRSPTEEKQKTEGYSYVNAVGKSPLTDDQQYMYANTPFTAAMPSGITNDVMDGNDVMKGDNDVIMEDNDVYEGGTQINEEQSVYALAKETEDVNEEHIADDGVTIEENDVYEGTGHTVNKDDELIFEENDAYEISPIVNSSK